MACMPIASLAIVSAFDPADAKAALAQLPHSAAVLRSTARRLMRSPILAARRICARGWSGCSNLRPSIRDDCNWLGGCGASRGGSPAPNSNRCSRSFLCWKRFTAQSAIWNACTCARRPLSASWAAIAYPRIVVTHRPSQREADWAYGPFASRAAAERFAEEALKLFLLRRCTDDLDPNPSHPGCVYSEMKMCLAPCYQGCTDERYARGGRGGGEFLATRGESRLVTLRAQRDEASVNLEFESAAALHAQVQRVEAVRALAAELVRPLSQLRAVILQAPAKPGEVAVFLFENGRLRGPLDFRHSV